MKIRSGDLSKAGEVSSLLVSQNPELNDDNRFIGAVAPNVALVVHVHSQYHYYNVNARVTLKQSLERARYGVTPARFQTHDLSDRFPNVTWRTVYNGVDPRRYYPSNWEQRRLWRNERGIPEDCTLVCFIGRLEPAKGSDILEKFCGFISDGRLHVLIQFPSENERYRLEAVRLKELNPEHVHLLHDELTSERAIRHCDVLLTPSLSEVCPLVVLEAFHCGLNVIGTKATPFYEDLPDFGMPPESYKFLELPSDVDVRRPREELGVPSATAETLAHSLMEVARTLSVPNDDQREATSGIIGRSPLTQDHMLQELQEVYENAVSTNTLLRGIKM